MIEINELKKLYHGCLWLEKTDGFLRARRFTKEQMNYYKFNKFFYDRTFCSASVTLEFTTTAESFSFDYKLFTDTGVISTFEVYEDGFLTGKVSTKEAGTEGVLEFSLRKGLKKVVLYLPNYVEYGVRNFDIRGEYVPVRKRRERVLFIGDSITQGGGPQRSGQTFVDITARSLGYEVINQGIGGYVFDKSVVKKLGFNPKKIVVALGTNNIWKQIEDFEIWRTVKENNQDVSEFFVALTKSYNVPVLAVLPTYMGHKDQKTINEKFSALVKIIRECAKLYENVQVANAYDMIPHFPDYFTEDFVHPNALGMETYAKNLIKKIREIKF